MSLPKPPAFKRLTWRWFAHLGLAWLLLLTQQGAWQHGLSHWSPTLLATATPGAGTSLTANSASTNTPHQHQDQADALCLSCLAYSAMASSLTSSPLLALASLLAHLSPVPQGQAQRAAPAEAAYQSRAPPR